MRTGYTFTIGCGECSKRFIGFTILQPFPVDSEAHLLSHIAGFLHSAAEQVAPQAASHSLLYHYNDSPNIQLFRED